MDLSIIVPVYNVENYLNRCLDSIFNQNFSGSFEVIAVEDCSSDKSLEILMNYKLKKPNLIIANTIKGKGVSFIENEVVWHHKLPSDEEYKKAIEELNIQLENYK